jgi:hypothetical protein
MGWRPTLTEEHLRVVISPGVVSVELRGAFRPGPDDEGVEVERGSSWSSLPSVWQSKAPCAKRGTITAWSPRSRCRMARAIAERDWSGGGYGLGTLTYPGDWQAVASTPEVVKRRHLPALRRRWARRWGRPEAFWKLEFQARGAPHVHLLFRMPVGVTVQEFRRWLASAWFAVVRSGDERHLRAGTSVDAQWRQHDAGEAIGRYFAKHGVWATKEYQHDVPEEWETTGRWWGAWNLPPVRAVAYLPVNELTPARRVARKWFRSTHQPRAVLRAIERHDGRDVVRVGHRGGRLRSLTGRTRHGFFLLARDGPSLALALCRVNEFATRPTDRRRPNGQATEGWRAPDSNARVPARDERVGVRDALDVVPGSRGARPRDDG